MAVGVTAVLIPVFPPATSTLPLKSTAEAWSLRAVIMLPVKVNLSVAAS